MKSEGSKVAITRGNDDIGARISGTIGRDEARSNDDSGVLALKDFLVQVDITFNRFGIIVLHLLDGRNPTLKLSGPVGDDTINAKLHESGPVAGSIRSPCEDDDTDLVKLFNYFRTLFKGSMIRIVGRKAQLLCSGNRVALDIAEKTDGDLRSNLMAVLDGRNIEGLDENTLGHVVLIDKVNDILHLAVRVGTLDLKKEVATINGEILKLFSKSWEASASKDGMDPGASIKSLELSVGEITDFTCAVGGTIDGGVVKHERHVILAGLSIVLDPLSASTTGNNLGNDGVLRARRRHTTVADDDEGIILKGTNKEVVSGELVTETIGEVVMDALGLNAEFVVAVTTNPDEGTETHGNKAAHDCVPGSLIIGAMRAQDIISDTSVLSDGEPGGKRGVVNSLDKTDGKASLLGSTKTHVETSIISGGTNRHPAHLVVILSNTNSTNIAVRNRNANAGLRGAGHFLTTADEHITKENTVEGFLANAKLVTIVRGINRVKTSDPFSLRISLGLSNKLAIKVDGNTHVGCGILTEKYSAAGGSLQNHIISENVIENTL